MQTNFYIIVPCYNEEKNIDEFIAEANSALDKYKNFKILFIDDGSNDLSFEIINEISSKDSNVISIKLNRNSNYTFLPL